LFREGHATAILLTKNRKHGFFLRVEQ